MSMPDIHLYLDNETFKAMHDLEKGEASKIFKNAIKEHSNLTDDLETIEKRLDLLYQDQNSINSQIKFLEEKKQKLLDIKKEEEELILKEKGKEKEKEKAFENNIRELFEFNIKRPMTDAEWKDFKSIRNTDNDFTIHMYCKRIEAEQGQVKHPAPACIEEVGK